MQYAEFIALLPKKRIFRSSPRLPCGAPENGVSAPLSNARGFKIMLRYKTRGKQRKKKKINMKSICLIETKKPGRFPVTCGADNGHKKTPGTRVVKY